MVADGIAKMARHTVSSCKDIRDSPQRILNLIEDNRLGRTWQRRAGTKQWREIGERLRAQPPISRRNIFAIDRLRISPISSSFATADNICNLLNVTAPIGNDGEEGTDDWMAVNGNGRKVVKRINGEIIEIFAIFSQLLSAVQCLFKIDEKKQEFISGDINGRRGRYLGTARSILLAENNHLKLIIAGEHTGAGNGTEDIGTGTLEQGFRALLLQDLRSKPSSIGDEPSQGKASEEAILQGSGEEHRLERIVHSEVEATVDDDSDA
nr:hypothetical protein BN1708_000269 [Ipomoea batatas]